MQLISEMPLPYFPVESPEFRADPMPFVEAARRDHPWLARFSEGYVVHGYQALKDLAFMDDKLEMGLHGIVEFYGAQETPWADFMHGMLNSTTGEDHRRLRDAIARAFTPAAANRARPLMRTVISDLLDEWVPRGEFDFAEFASWFPVTVLCGVFGVSPEPIPRIRSSIELHMASLTMDRSIYDEFIEGYNTLLRFADEMVRERERSGSADGSGLLDQLMAANREGKLSDTELRYMILVLFIGGYDTSKNMLTLTVYTLLDYPEYWKRCAEDLEFCRKIIAEMLRYSTISTVFRNVKQEFEYDGLLFPKGALVTFATPLANRDPAAFPDPMRFDPERVNENHHVAFGRGVHICPGQFLARTQLEEGLHLVTRRIPHPRLAGEIGWRPFLAAWGLSTLPIAFDLQK